MYFFGSWKGWIHVFSSLYIMHVNYDTDFVTFSPTVCMEVGSGSGVCITFLARMIGPSAVYW
jgi:hypothetical protein